MKRNNIYKTFRTFLAFTLACVLFAEQSLVATQESPENLTFVQRVAKKVKDAATAVQQTVSDVVQTPEFWIVSTLIVASLVMMRSKNNPQDDAGGKKDTFLPKQDPKQAQQVLDSLKKPHSNPSVNDGNKAECSLCLREQTEVPLLKIFYHQNKPCFSCVCQECMNENALKKSDSNNDASEKKSFDVFTTCPNCRTDGEHIRTEQL